jgi:hypothetical protein
MVIMKVYGGLAGQMFQYSLGRHLSFQDNNKLLLDTHWYNKSNTSGFVRDFGLQHLNTRYETISNKGLLWWKLRLAGKINNFKLFGLEYIKEVDFSRFDSSILGKKGNILLDGYWNSHKYFDEIRAVLLEELRPKEAPDERNRQCLDKIQKTNSISAHFRRGDYALTSFHGMLSKEYYTQAIDALTENMTDPQLFIFSDEPEWVIANMDFKIPYEVVDFNKDKKNYWDIELMKNCKHNIIANSGFSWWGAWLNNNSGKTVVAPRNWVNAENSSFDNIPEQWILL